MAPVDEIKANNGEEPITGTSGVSSIEKKEETFTVNLKNETCPCSWFNLKRAKKYFMAPHRPINLMNFFFKSQFQIINFLRGNWEHLLDDSPPVVKASGRPVRPLETKLDFRTQLECLLSILFLTFMFIFFFWSIAKTHSDVEKCTKDINEVAKLFPQYNYSILERNVSATEFIRDACEKHHNYGLLSQASSLILLTIAVGLFFVALGLRDIRKNTFWSAEIMNTYKTRLTEWYNKKYIIDQQNNKFPKAPVKKDSISLNIFLVFIGVLFLFASAAHAVGFFQIAFGSLTLPNEHYVSSLVGKVALSTFYFGISYVCLLWIYFSGTILNDCYMIKKDIWDIAFENYLQFNNYTSVTATVKVNHEHAIPRSFTAIIEVRQDEKPRVLNVFVL